MLYSLGPGYPGVPIVNVVLYLGLDTKMNANSEICTRVSAGESRVS